MLDVPVEVKILLKSDSVKKNVRVLFPYDEIDDICNDRLVSESLSFTESFCSQTELKFGLCEASQISFDCFDAPNVKGKTIDVIIEIECDEFGESRDDLDYKVYPIPLGRFVIDECKRDSTDLSKRSVVAYSKNATGDWYLSNFVNLAKFDNCAYNAPLELNLDCLLMSEFPDLTSELIGTDESGVDTTRNTIVVPNFDTSDNPDLTIYLMGTYFGAYAEFDKTRLFRLTIQDDSPSLKLNMYTKFVTNKLIDDIFADISAKSVDGKTITVKYTKQNLYDYLYPILYKSLQNRNLVVYGMGGFNYFDYFVEPISVFSPYAYPSASGRQAPIISFQTTEKFLCNFQMYKYDASTGTMSYFDESTTSKFANSKLEKLDTSTLTTTSVTIKRVKQNSQSYTAYVTEQSVEDFGSIQPILEGYCELKGCFGRFNRYGSFELVHLAQPSFPSYPDVDIYPDDTLYPMDFNNVVATIDTTMYSKCWYEEELTKPYSCIICNYSSSSGNDSYIDWLIKRPSQSWTNPDHYVKSNYIEYDLSNNYYIQKGTYTSAQIRELLQPLRDAIKDIRYIAVEIDVVGVPYIESGDLVKIELHSGQIESYVLRRTLNGIQSLTDNLTST